MITLFFSLKAEYSHCYPRMAQPALTVGHSRGFSLAWQMMFAHDKQPVHCMMDHYTTQNKQQVTVN